MMKFKVVGAAVAAVGIATCAFAQEVVNVKGIKAKGNPVLKLTGGEIQRPGVKQGEVAFLNGQKTVPSSELMPIAKKLAKMLRIKFDVRDVELQEGPKGPEEAFKKSGVDFAVVIVECDKCDNTIAIFPEKKYAVVNVSALRANGGEGAFLTARTKKEAIRAFFYVAGAAAAPMQGNLMSAMKDGMSDLDKLTPDAIPVEVVGRVSNYLDQMGCETRAFVTYRQACKEGWAPAPTNDYQKTIWNRIHSEKEKGPPNALKIVPPKK